MKNNVNASIKKKSIPTYIPKEPIKLPIFYEKRQYQGASGKIYPIPVSDSFSDELVDKLWTVGVLENEYIYVEILPELGGRIKRALYKKHNYDFMYHNSIIKPAGIGIAGSWISGGIEFNWPQHHRPTTSMPVEALIEQLEDGAKTIWVGEVEPMYKTKGMAGITLEPGRTYIRSKAKIYNGTAVAQPFMWWANLAAPATKSYRIVFPKDVEYVFDHDRRAVMSWPIAKGKYGDSRAFDFGEHTDLSYYRNIKPQSSYMVPMGQSNLDFISGYDEEKNLGIVSVADHYVAPAKKLFTWGVSEFSNMWCMNLTDSDGPYIEIMTGAYTDNQPDFSWIQPYETKEFEQYWYPISDIGLVKNATIDAALNLEENDGKLFLGICATGIFSDCNIEVFTKEGVLFSDIATLTPDDAYIRNIELSSSYHKESLAVSVKDSTGRVLVDYKTFKRGDKIRPDPRSIMKKPEEIETVDELYINGLHLVQYRHHTFVPEDYFNEGLRRDPFDIRCNLEVGKILFSRGRFSEALNYFDKAIERLTSRNETPYDVEVYYYRGLALIYLEETEKAYDSLYKCVWQYTFRSAAYFALAQIDASKKEYVKSISELDLSIETNAKNNKAKVLKATILRNLNRSEQAVQIIDSVLREDPLDLNASFEMHLLDSKNTDRYDKISMLLKEKPDYAVDLAIGYIKAGFIDEAIKALSFCEANPLALFYLSYCYSLINNKVKVIEYNKKAEEADSTYCFPSRLEDIAVLEFAMSVDPSCSKAPYYLGCLFFDKERYDDAILLFEQSRNNNDKFSHTLRNLALLYYDKKGNYTAAQKLLEQALSLDHDPRIFYEYSQLLKNMGFSIESRLSVYDEYIDCSDMRDDSYVEKLSLIGMQGRYLEALELAKNRQFHVYEGGEGKLTRIHGWFNILEGNKYLEQGDANRALEYYQNALTTPKNYGEARSLLEEFSHIYYHIGLAQELLGKHSEAVEAFTNAASSNSIISELSIFRAKAMMKIGKGNEASEVLHKMISDGEQLLKNKNDYPYFGGGSPTPQPFENDIAKKNTISALVLKAYGYTGLGQTVISSKIKKELAEIDPTNLSLYILNQVT